MTDADATTVADPPPPAPAFVGDDALAEFADAPAPPADATPDGTVGFTHFDAAGAADDEVVVLVPRAGLDRLAVGAMVRVVSSADARAHAPARTYVGVVTAGPFAEPSGIKVDAPVTVATTLGGKAHLLLPRYHGRATVRLTAELLGGDDKRPVPPTRRPRPNSPVVPLTDDETRAALRIGGDARLGVVLGRDAIEVALDTTSKAQLPRHLAVLGTTGGGKSNTVAVAVAGLQKGGAAVVVLDVEGEYADLDAPADDARQLDALAARGLAPSGVADVRVLHPVGRATARAGDPSLARPFCLRFEDLSPYSVMDVLNLTDAQQQRFLKAYDVLKSLLKDLNIFPRREGNAYVAEDQQRLLDLDELEQGFPRMTLAQLRDVVSVCMDYCDRGEPTSRSRKDKEAEDTFEPRQLYSPELRGPEQARRVAQLVARARVPGHYVSWQTLLGKLNRIARLGVFDNPKARPLDPAELTRPGRVTVLDLSDTDSPTVNNLVIASVLRQTQQQQERDVERAQAEGRRPNLTVVVVEEAHEFLSSTRVSQQPHLFEQLARIAKRGRKRWLGLMFVTQFPQHLPDELLGLVNSYVLHAIRDPSVVARLARQVPGLDAGQWARVPALAPGQAVVALATAARPVLAQIDPAACRRRLEG